MSQHEPAVAEATERPESITAVRPIAGRAQQRMRTRRVRVGDLKLGGIEAIYSHGGASTKAHVEDLSPHGAALVIDARQVTGPYLAGDRLPDVQIRSARGLLYDGAAIVRRVAERGEQLVVGVELASQSVDLAELYRHDARHGFAERFAAAEQGLHLDEISPEFKAFVADMRAYLEAMRAFLKKEEEALRGEDQLSRDEALAQYVDEAGPQVVARLAAFADELNRLVGHLSDREHVQHRSFLRTHLLPLWMEAPFMRRAYEKPLGYAGDYEMMNMLYRNEVEGDSLFGKIVNLYATQEGAARANINRIEYLGAQIREVVAKRSEPRVRMASIGCGPTREIRSLLEAEPQIGPRLDVALVDQEERSIAYCERTLGPLAMQTGARVDFMRESIRRLLTTRRLSEALGPRALIYSAGLFDYLSDATFARLLSTLYEALVPGGLLLIGNVAAHNPSRWPMEYYVEWFLIHRSPSDLLALADKLEPRPSAIEVQSEPTGINLFLRIVK